MKKPILCLDFDGVIHSYTTGWKGAHIIQDSIVEGAISFILEALKHFEVAIFSSRSNQKNGIEAMRQYLKDNAGQAWYESIDGPGLESVTFPKEKPPAKISIDDRAITFTGKWPDMELLKTFQPWNKV